MRRGRELVGADGLSGANDLMCIEPPHAPDQGRHATIQTLTWAAKQKALFRACAVTAVDLTWTYSNRQDLADLLRRARAWLSNDRQGPVQDRQASVRARLAPTVPRRVVDRLGKDVVHEIIEARAAGVKLREIAERYGISESSVKRTCTKAADLNCRSAGLNSDRTRITLR